MAPAVVGYDAAGPPRRLRRLLLFMTLTAAVAGPADAVGRFNARNITLQQGGSSVPLPFPLPEQVVRADAITALVLWPHAFKLVDASRAPTRTVALALERYWVRTDEGQGR